MDPLKKAAEGLEKVIQSNAAIQQANREGGQRIRSALEAQIALPGQVERLNQQTGELLKIADAQKELAEESGVLAKILIEQTDRLVQETVSLVKFTRGLVWLTVAVGLFAIAQIVIMLFDYFSKTH